MKPLSMTVDVAGRGVGNRRRHREQLAGPGDVVCTLAVGETSVVADALEALGQDVDQNRRMNSPVSSVMTLKRARPSAR